MIEVTLQEVRQAIENLVNESTYFNNLRFKSMNEAIELLAKEKCTRINDFAELDQETIEQQAADYDGYLDGAKVGDIVWGDNEMWVSQVVIEGWLAESSDKLTGSNEDIEDVADFVCDDLIVSTLKKHNEK
ncbi:hypothetical protein [Vibrio sp. S512-13]|uniref:hypothetical protein n=1 Tax=Vibrio sp. S512-13 TaxID=1620394 RepID=UPI0005EE932E|nr:hypothetical protein [Vibrio sp. S512-13]KJQ87460.1 hypothetical protein UG53_07945 [Vibrio sp. S512-13]KJQ87462.1 hypothetical protein UG53_07960 [Vibrio sp. S512-13]